MCKDSSMDSYEGLKERVDLCLAEGNDLLGAIKAHIAELSNVSFSAIKEIEEAILRLQKKGQHVPKDLLQLKLKLIVENEKSSEIQDIYARFMEGIKLLYSEAVPETKRSKSPVQKKEPAERNKLLVQFWTQLLKKSKDKTKLHANIKAGGDNWISSGAGKSGMVWSYALSMERAKVELVVDRGPKKKSETDHIFNLIRMNKEDIEKQFGDQLIWDQVDNRQACYIRYYTSVGGLKDRDKWDQIQNTLIDNMIRLEKSLIPYILKVKI
jgi:hypothetical protein